MDDSKKLSHFREWHYVCYLTEFINIFVLVMILTFNRIVHEPNESS